MVNRLLLIFFVIINGMETEIILKKEDLAKEAGLKSSTITLMVIVALFFDVLNALFNLIVMYWVVTIIAYLTFFVWFLIHGIFFWKPKRLLAAGGSFIIEIIPVISVLPAITAAVLVIALDAKARQSLPVVPSKKRS